MIAENRVATEIVDVAFKVYKGLGPGLFESVYETIMEGELGKRGLGVERQVGIPVEFEGVRFGLGFRADLLVEGLVIVEIKSVEMVTAVHRKQLLTYLRLADKKLGMFDQLQRGLDEGRDCAGGEWVEGGERRAADLPALGPVRREW